MPPQRPPESVKALAGAVGEQIGTSTKRAFEAIRRDPGKFLSEHPGEIADTSLDLMGPMLGMAGIAGRVLRKVPTSRKDELVELMRRHPTRGESAPRIDIEQMRARRREAVRNLSVARGPEKKKERWDAIRELSRTHKAIEEWEHWDKLPAEERARLDRAVKQGFTVRGLHGTRGDIEEFDPGLLGTNTEANSARLGFFFSKDPETAGSRWYTGGMPSEQKFWKIDPTVADEFDEVLHGIDESFTQLVDTVDRKLGTGRESAIVDLVGRLRREGEYELAARLAAGKDEHNWFMGLSFSGPEKILGDYQARKKIVDTGVSAHEGPYLEYYKAYQKELERIGQELEDWATAFSYDWESASGPNIMPVLLKMENPLIHDYKGGSYRDYSYSKLCREAKKGGYDSVIMRNTVDGGPETDVYVVFKPEQIRSANAAFDPDKAGSTDILASVAWPLGLGAAAEAYMRNKREKNRRSK